jgi:hypothetical protein
MEHTHFQWYVPAVHAGCGGVRPCLGCPAVPRGSLCLVVVLFFKNNHSRVCPGLPARGPLSPLLRPRQTAEDEAGNKGNTVVLSVVVLARAPGLALVRQPPLASSNMTMSLTAAADLDAMFVSRYRFITMAGSATLPYACQQPLIVATDGVSNNASFVCDGLADGQYRCGCPRGLGSRHCVGMVAAVMYWR